MKRLHSATPFYARNRLPKAYLPPYQTTEPPNCPRSFIRPFLAYSASDRKSANIISRTRTSLPIPAEIHTRLVLSDKPDDGAVMRAVAHLAMVEASADGEREDRVLPVGRPILTRSLRETRRENTALVRTRSPTCFPYNFRIEPSARLINRATC
jgi:hypothetical protein